MAAELRQVGLADLAPSAERPDVLVAGAGPAGAVAAGSLAGAGLRVLLVDRASFPRVKVCGEALAHGARRVLERLGLWDEIARMGHAVGRARAIAPSGSAVSVPGPFVTLSRARFDARLASWATDRGALFVRAAVKDVTVGEDGVRAELAGDDASRIVAARRLVLATGAASALGARLGLVDGVAQAVALRGHLETDAPVPDELLGLFSHGLAPGYGWVFPLGGRLCNVGAVAWDAAAGRRGAPVSERLAALAAHPAVRELFARGRLVARPRAAQIRSGMRGLRAAARGPVLAVGDAAAAALPLTDEGIGKALETGMIAAEAIVAAGPDGDAAALYRERIERAVRPAYEGFLAAERWAARPRLVDLAAWCVTRSPRLARGLERIVTEERDPRQVFSLRAVLDGLRRRR
ncbi:MAG: NAD(P)/FAD-dependent oxidoreductase [Acidobacteria bacterium]|nr:MAG: NAD(P)/FAD-dependent oxidoreductase [Acidobacteriota bacterium]